MTPLEQFARWHYRRRFWVAGCVLLAAALVLPAARDLSIDNGIEVWFKRDDPNWMVYREYREEFGGSRNVIVALKAKDLFTRENLRYLDSLTRELERLPHVLKVYSLATANRVIATEDTLDVRSYLDGLDGLDGLDSRDPAEIRAEVLEDERVVDDLVSRDGTVASITVSFDEDRSDSIREALLAEVRRLAAAGRPPEVETFFNGNLVISESYDRASRRNLAVYAPFTLVLLVAASYFLFRSWARVGLIVSATALAVGCTLALFSMFDFPFNIVSTVTVPLVGILCIADDIHILQHFDRVLSQTGDRERAFRETIVSQLPPILGASATTSLGMLSLATSQVAAVREFGMVAAAGVAVDLAISFAVIPLGLTLAPPRSGAAPSGARITGVMLAVSRLTAHRTPLVLGLTGIAVVWSLAGIARLRASTNHVEFFREGSELPTSARVIDEGLSGINSFEVVLESAEEAFNEPELLRRIDAFVGTVESMEHVRRAVSFLESLKKVHAELYPGSVGELPETREAVVQELFLFGLSDRGRDALRSFLSTDYRRMRIWVKLPAVSSEESTAQILEVERLARRAFEGSSRRIKVIVTGPGKMFSALDVYLVESQLRSFATAFVAVFGVIFLLFRSVRYGLVSIPTNLVPVLIVLGVMGWLGITLNVATVVVASIALGVIDDDTVHFLMTYRREREGGAGSEGAIRTSIREVGGAALLAAVINCLTFGVTAISDYKPAAYWGWLMALVVILAFLSEVLLLPACLRAGARFFQSRGNENLGSL